MKKQINFSEVFEEGEDNKPQLTLISNIPDRITEGKDELNFAEFPLSAISDRSDASIKTLSFEDKIFDKSKNQYITRKVMITGSDAYGLPNTTDEEVLLALIQLSKLQGFRSKRVYFTRYQIISILGWPDNGQSYQRLGQALNRWIGVTLYYKNAWRKKAGEDEEAAWSDESFHMLEAVSIKDAKAKDPRDSAVDTTSYFQWNDVVFKSFQKGNVKSLNYDFFLSLESSISKRLYRFLDKRFYHKSSLEFDLKNLACEHIGISRNSPTGELKRKINGAIDELESKNFLEPIPREQRYIKQGPGVWKVIFKKKHSAASLPEVALDDSLESRLINFGVRAEKAQKLINDFPQNVIEEKLSIALWMKEQRDSRVSANPAGFLVSSIEQGYVAPRQYTEVVETTNRKIVAQKIVQEKVAQKEIKQKKEQSAEAKKREAIDKFLNGLSYEARELLEEDVLEKADTGSKKMIELGGKVGESIKKVLIDKYVLGLISHD